MSGRINVDIAVRQRILLWHRLLSAKQRPDSRNELAHAEGFGDVVVGAEFKSNNAIGLVAACSENQYGCTGILLVSSQLTADLEPIHSGKHQIQNHEVCG